MPPEDQELSYLWDIRKAAQEVVTFTKCIKFAEFEKNKLLRYGVERQLHVIGEAAHHISPQFRNKHPEISWNKIIALRNVLAHEYGEVLTSRVWIAATESVPELLRALTSLLPE